MKLRDYIDQRFRDAKDYVDSNLYQDRKAVDQYSKTNDEWKAMHNGLQRKMEEDRSLYVTKEQMNKQSVLIIMIMGVLIAIYEAFIK